jgi:hypothetical protein
VSGRIEKAGANSKRKRNGESEHPRCTSENGGRERQRPWLKLEAVRGMENWREYSGWRKSAWTRLKRRDPEGISPQGLALNKNR